MGIFVHSRNIPENVIPVAEQNILNDYASRVADVVEAAAIELYRINNFSDSMNVKFRQWYEAVSDFLRTRQEQSFIEAKYGYAVEEYVNLRIAAGIPFVPFGYRVRLQATHGNTRPDIVILRADGKEVAWLDITNQSSLGHISGKNGNWQDNNKFIAELLYPDFDPNRIERGNGSIGSRITAGSIVRQKAVHDRTLMRHLAQKMNTALCKLTESIRRGNIIFLPDVAECIEQCFGVIFRTNYKHPIIKSMLRLYVGCSDANCRYDAYKYLDGLYREVGQDKSAAVSYIEESLNISDPYIYY